MNSQARSQLGTAFTQLDLELFKIFGRKELTEGCLIRDTTDSSHVKYAFDNDEGNPIILQLEGIFKGQHDDIDIEDLQDEDEFEILGHEPTITDVFRVAEDKRRITIMYFTEYTALCFNPIDRNLRNPDYIPYNPSIPLLQQTDETKQQLINLFQSQ